VTKFRAINCMNYISPFVFLKSDLDVQQSGIIGLRSVCSTSKSDLSSKIKCYQIQTIIFTSSVTPEAAAKFELFFNKLEVGLVNI
jgi:hypothetical protein